MTYPSLSFAFGETIDMFRDQVRDFVTAKLQSRVMQIDQDNQFPMDMWRKFDEMGLLGIIVDEEHGSSALGYLIHVVIMGEISRAPASVMLSYGAHSNLCVNQIKRNDNAEQKVRHLSVLVSGEHIGALAMGEPNAGSDVVSMKLRVDRVDDCFAPNGSKMRVTNGPDTHTYVIYAKTDADKDTHRITAFIVERDWRGFSRGPKLDKLGMRGSNTCELIFQNAEMPEENVLDTVNGGVKALVSSPGYEYVVLSGGPVGIMQACMDAVVPYIHDRCQLGQSIGEFQLAQGKVADMYIALDTNCVYLYAVAAACDRGEATRKDATGVILYSVERATQMALDAIQILDGSDYINEFPTDHLLHDAKLYGIGAGISEIHHMLIGCELFNETR